MLLKNECFVKCSHVSAGWKTSHWRNMTVQKDHCYYPASQLFEAWSPHEVEKARRIVVPARFQRRSPPLVVTVTSWLRRVSRMAKAEKISRSKTKARPMNPYCWLRESVRAQYLLVSGGSAQTVSAVAVAGWGPGSKTGQSLESCRYLATLGWFLSKGWNARFPSVGDPKLVGSALLELGSLVP